MRISSRMYLGAALCAAISASAFPAAVVASHEDIVNHFRGQRNGRSRLRIPGKPGKAGDKLASLAAQRRVTKRTVR